jgi:hypothetical protein
MRTRESDLWEDVVVAILAVNQYTLEKTYQLLDGLRTQGLVDPENLRRWTTDEIELRLKRSGCDRGEFMTHLFAVRLSHLGMAVGGLGVELCVQILLRNNADSISKLLLPVKGVGPRVMKNIFLLRGISPSAAD